MKKRIPFLLTGQRAHIIIKRKLHNIALRKERDKQMPSKPKFTREEIVEKMPELVTQRGKEALTARAMGQRLGSSIRPIFTVFKNMENLQGEVRLAAVRRFEAYAGREMGETPPFKRVGMQMVLFALEQPRLYQLLFLRENRGAVRFDDVLSELGETAEGCIQAICRDYDLSREKARRIFENMWIYTFGVGALCARGMCRFFQEAVGKKLSTAFRAMLLLAHADDSAEAAPPELIP